MEYAVWSGLLRAASYLNPPSSTDKTPLSASDPSYDLPILSHAMLSHLPLALWAPVHTFAMPSLCFSPREPLFTYSLDQMSSAKHSPVPPLPPWGRIFNPSLMATQNTHYTLDETEPLNNHRSRHRVWNILCWVNIARLTLVTNHSSLLPKPKEFSRD